MPATVAGWPTLSQLRGADYSYFGQLAGYLEKISPQVQNALADLAENVKRPGGVEWEGEAGDAAIAQAQADLITARPVIWSWDDVAASARRWQDELQAGTRTVLDAVDDAQRDGFTVNEDYRASSTRRAATEAEFAQRAAAANAHSAYIRHHVATLVGNESRINSELKTMTAGWGTLTFPQSGGGAHAPLPLDPTTSPTPEPAQCKPEDQAKLIKKFAEWCAERDRISREATEWDRKYEPGHPFNMNDPAQAAEYERGEKLRQDRAKLIHDYGELLKEATTCGAEQDEKTGDIIWPDGTRTTLRPR
jgi:hypothetical protein